MRYNRSIVFLFLVVLLGQIMISCKKDEGGGDSITPTDSIQIVTPIPTLVDEPKNVKNSDPKHIRWAVTDFRSGIPSEEVQTRINNFLKDQGVDFSLEFVFNSSFYIGDAYLSWVVEEECDIFSLGNWSDSVSCIEYAEQMALPLGDWLQTGEGRMLKMAYGEAEWKKVSPGGKTLAVPCWSVPNYYNGALYVAINEKYSELFSSFDGTYTSLKALYKQINNQNLKIEISRVTNDTITGLLGYELAYSDLIPYDPKTRHAVEPARFGAEASALFEMIYEDLKDGVLINMFDQEFGSIEDCEVLAYIFEGIRKIPEGYTVFCVSRDLYECNLNGAYAVSSKTVRKELALRVLGICLSNPEIAAIINWGEERADAEKWTEKTNLRSADKPTELSGFYPHLSVDEKKNLNTYAKVLDEELVKLYFLSEGKYVLNSSFQSAYNQLGKKQDTFSKGIDAWNREAEKWFKENQ